MIAQHNGKIIRVENKIIKPMTGKGPSSGDYTNPLRNAIYLSYFRSTSTGYDQPEYGPAFKLSGSYYTSKLNDTPSNPWYYYRQLYNSSDSDYGQLKCEDDSFIPSDVRTVSCLAKVYSYGSYRTSGRVELNSDIIFKIEDTSYSRITVSIQAQTADGSKTKSKYGWTKNSSGTTVWKVIDKIGDVEHEDIFPWVRFTLIKNNTTWYAYVNDDLIAVFSGSTSSNSIWFRGGNSHGGSIDLTELFITNDDIAAGHRDKLNIQYQPTFDGALPLLIEMRN